MEKARLEPYATHSRETVFDANATIAPVPKSRLSPHVLAEAVHRTTPRQIGGGLVVSLRGGVAMEAVHRARVNITLMRHVGFLQRGVVRRPGLGQPGVQFAVMHQNGS